MGFIPSPFSKNPNKVKTKHKNTDKTKDNFENTLKQTKPHSRQHAQLIRYNLIKKL